MSEKLSIQWNDFQDNIKVAFGNLRENNNFADVTLVCGDGEQVQAHKVILAASSPFFQKLLGRNKHPHPLVYLRGVTSEDLLAVVDFLYFGEANVFQENLDSFLAVAEDFQLRGLMGKTDDKDIEIDEKHLKSEKYQESEKSLESENYLKSENDLPHTVLPVITTNSKIPKKSSKLRNPEEKRAVAIPSVLSGDLQALEERVKSMMEKSQNFVSNQTKRADICKVCGKEGAGNAIKDHIESNHIEGINIACNLCDKTFRSRNALRLHKRQHQQ